MKVLLDNCVPRTFERFLPGHDVSHTSRQNWTHLGNGALLDAAEDAGFEVVVTTDKSIPQQRRFTDRQISLIIMRAKSNAIPSLEPLASLVMVALLNIEPGTTVTVTAPVR